MSESCPGRGEMRSPQFGSPATPGEEGGGAHSADHSADHSAHVDELATSLGLSRGTVPLLRRALTHRSLNTGSSESDNERLEFLGDAVLGLVVNEHLYDAYPAATEGELSRMKSRLVSKRALAAAAIRLGLPGQLRLAVAEDAAGVRGNAAVQADAVEAVIAAVYLGEGLEAARALIRERLIAVTDVRSDPDFKSRLQEHCQEHFRELPVYEAVSTEGPPHDRRFTCAVRLKGEMLATGGGRSKKGAEQVAAELALKSLRRGWTPETAGAPD